MKMEVKAMAFVDTQMTCLTTTCSTADDSAWLGDLICGGTFGQDCTVLRPGGPLEVDTDVS